MPLRRSASTGWHPFPPPSASAAAPPQIGRRGEVTHLERRTASRCGSFAAPVLPRRAGRVGLRAPRGADGPADPDREHRPSATTAARPRPPRCRASPGRVSLEGLRRDRRRPSTPADGYAARLVPPRRPHPPAKRSQRPHGGHRPPGLLGHGLRVRPGRRREPLPHAQHPHPALDRVDRRRRIGRDSITDMEPCGQRDGCPVYPPSGPCRARHRGAAGRPARRSASPTSSTGGRGRPLRNGWPPLFGAAGFAHPGVNFGAAPPGGCATSSGLRCHTVFVGSVDVCNSPQSADYHRPVNQQRPAPTVGAPARPGPEGGCVHHAGLSSPWSSSSRVSTTW